jgi:PAS domain S-box-containing protein
MLKLVNEWIHALPMRDPALYRQARATQFMLVVLGLISLLAIPVVLVAPGDPAFRWIVLLSNSMIVASLWTAVLLLRRGQMNNAILLSASMLWLCNTVNLYHIGINAPGVVINFAIPIVLAGMAPQRRMLPIIVLLSVASIIFVGALETSTPSRAGLLNPNYPIRVKVAIILLAMICIGLLVDRLCGTLLRSLAEVREANQRLEQELAEHRRTEAALRESETHYRLIAENTHDMILILDTQGQILYVNPAVETILGYSPDALIGTSAFERLHPDDLPYVQRIWMKTNHNYVRHNGVRYRHQDGGYRWIDARTSLIQRGATDVVVGFGRDVTDQRRLEGQLMHSQKMEGLGRLAGSVAHDFNNILVVIAGYAELARMSISDDHPAAHDLSDILDATDRARMLTRQLLTFARRHEYSPRDVNLNTLVTNMQRMLRRLVTKEIEFTISTSPAPLMIKADPDQIAQVLMNLISNSCDAIDSAGSILIETASINISEQDALEQIEIRPGPYAELSVRDTGDGMDEATLRRIFEPFFTTKQDEQGTGLGMAICYGIVHQHGGTITVSSTLGGGTRVRILIPEAVEHDGAEAGQREVQEAERR